MAILGLKHTDSFNIEDGFGRVLIPRQACKKDLDFTTTESIMAPD